MTKKVHLRAQHFHTTPPKKYGPFCSSQSICNISAGHGFRRVGKRSRVWPRFYEIPNLYIHTFFHSSPHHPRNWLQNPRVFVQYWEITFRHAPFKSYPIHKSILDVTNLQKECYRGLWIVHACVQKQEEGNEGTIRFTCSSIIEHLINTNVLQKHPPELPAATLITPNWRAGAESQKGCEMPPPLQYPSIKKPEAKVGQPIPM